jgi:hypothetical protein
VPSPGAAPDGAATRKHKHKKQPIEVPPGSSETVTTDDAGNVVSELIQPPQVDPSSDRVIRDEVPLVGDSFGSGPSRLQFGILSFRFLLQTRFQRTFASDSENASASYRVAEDTLARDGDGWSIQRFFVRIGLDPYKYLELKTIIDLAEFMHDNADNAIKQAYVTFKPVPKHVELTVGAFKLPFSILELDPSADFPFADFGPSDTLAKDLGFAGRDIGAEVMVSPLPKPRHLRLGLGIFRGHAKDEHASLAGAIGARIETEPMKGLRFGVDWVGHPSTNTYLQPLEDSKNQLNPNPPDPQYPYQKTWSKGNAFSADVRYQRHRLLIEAEGMLGKRVDVATRYGASTFGTVWGLIAYRFHVGPVHLMPTLRAELLDADREHPVGLRRILSAGFNVYASKAVRFIVDLARTDVQANSPLLDQPKPIQATPYNELDETRIIAQLQVML